jgi:hypothetical protein
MAEFNPNVQQVADPNYMGYTKVVEGPPPNKAGAMRLGVLGDALEGTVKLADTAVKKQIDIDIHKQVDEQRDAYTSGLEKARAEQQGGIIAQAPGNLMDSNASMDAPPALDKTLDGIQTLAAARQAGKINDTYYTQQLNSIAKNVRNQYPGYRDYIDEKVKSATGMDPANAYYKNIMQDINASMAGKKEAADKVLNQLYSNNDIPGMPDIIAGYKAKLISEDTAVRFMNGNLQNKYKFDEWERTRKTKEAGKEEDKGEATTQFNSEFSAVAANRFDVVLTLPGLSNPATISKLVQDQAEGRIVLNDEQNNSLLSAMTSARRVAAIEGQKIAQQRGYAGRIGDAKKINDSIEQNLVVYDQTIDAIKNKEYGTAFFNQRRVQAQQADTEAGLQSDPSIGSYVRTTAAMTKFAGPSWVNTTMAAGLQNGMPEKFKSYMQDKIMKSQTPDDIRKDGVAKSLYQDVSEAQTKKIAVSSKVYDNLLDNITTINNPQAPDKVKLEVAKYAFNPQNDKLLDKWKMDYTDPTTGKQVQGKYSVFTRLTSPDITDNLWRVSKQDPKVWKDYKNWSENSFSRLYGEEINRLNTYQDEGSMKLNVSWDADNRRFSVMGEGGKPLRAVTSVDQNYITDVNNTVNRLNTGLNSLGKVQDKEGNDTSAYLMSTMMTLGLRPGEKVQGLPQKMMDAIAASKKSTAKRFEDTFSK